MWSTNPMQSLTKSQWYFLQKYKNDSMTHVELQKLQIANLKKEHQS
jgi:hypothetical protein